MPLMRITATVYAFEINTNEIVPVPDAGPERIRPISGAITVDLAGEATECTLRGPRQLDLEVHGRKGDARDHGRATFDLVDGTPVPGLVYDLLADLVHLINR